MTKLGKMSEFPEIEFVSPNDPQWESESISPHDPPSETESEVNGHSESISSYIECEQKISQDTEDKKNKQPD